MDSNVEVGALLRGTFETIKSTPAGSAGYVAGLGALGSAMDLLNPESISNMPYTIASVFAGFYLLRAMLVNTGVTQAAESNRVGAYFGLSILSGLGIVLGLVVLIVPGIILIVRWLLAYAILVSEDATVSGALSESWRRTGAHIWPLLAGILIVLLIGIAALAIYVSNDFVPGVPVEAALVAGNVLLATMTVIFTALGVEAYRMLRADEGLPEVFA